MRSGRSSTDDPAAAPPTTLLLAAAILLAGWAPATPPGATPTASVSAKATRAELRGLIEDVTAATAYRHRLTDDLGRWMDTAKVIRIPEASTFAAVYATWRTFLYDPASETAAELHVRTHAGECRLRQPKIEMIEIDGQRAVLVTLYLTAEGARGDEDGPLLCHRVLPGDT